MKPAPDKSQARLLEITQRVGKSYAFADDHDETEPLEVFFQHSQEGVVLFLIFYSRACRFSACTGCNLPSTSASHHVGFRSLMKQSDKAFAQPEVARQYGDIKKVIVSNQGSVLDEETFSSTALMYLCAKINLHLPSVEVVTLETRCEYVDDAELEFIARAMAEGDGHPALEIAIGFEAFDDEIRNRQFRKGLSLEAFERLVDQVASHGFRLKCYFMQKPVVGMSDEAAVADIHAAIDYLSGVAAKRGIAIGLHLNPTYAAHGTPLADAFLAGDYEAPRLVDVARAARHGRGKELQLFIGLNDEGLAVEGGSFARPGEEALIEQLERFNRSSDYDILDAIIAGAGA